MLWLTFKTYFSCYYKHFLSCFQITYDGNRDEQCCKTNVQFNCLLSLLAGQLFSTTSQTIGWILPSEQPVWLAEQHGLVSMLVNSEPVRQGCHFDGVLTATWPSKFSASNWKPSCFSLINCWHFLSNVYRHYQTKNDIGPMSSERDVSQQAFTD